MTNTGIIETYSDENKFNRKISIIEYRENQYKVPHILNERYEITGVLALGGTGIIFSAKDTDFFDRKVLIKTSKHSSSLFNYPNNENLKPEIEKNREIINREKLSFLHAWNRNISEVPVLLDSIEDINPNIYGPHINKRTKEKFYIEDEDLIYKELYLVLSYIDGQVLSKKIEEEIDNKITFARALLNSIGKTLIAFHSNKYIESLDNEIKMIYLDLKPDNIIAAKDGGFVLIDLGSFSYIINDKNYISNFIFTPGYSAPEINDTIPEIQKLTPAADVYSLGAIIYEILTGDKPRVSSTNEIYDFDFRKIDNYIQENNYNKGWTELIKKMLANKSDRYNNFDEVLKDLP